MRTTSRMGIVATLATLLTATAWLAACAGGDERPEDTSNDASFGVFAPPPESLEWFRGRVTAVVRGSYVEYTELFYRTQYGNPAIPQQNQEWPVTLIRFEVDDYIVGEGPDDLILGQYGDLANGVNFGGAAAPEFGTEITLVVDRWNVDPTINVATYGDYGRFVERDGKVTYAFLGSEKEGHPVFSAIPFAEGMSLAELEDAFRQLGRESGLKVK